jgi:hypothetical protein
LAVAIVGFASYIILVDNYWIRTWGIPNTALLVLGTLIAAYAISRRPRWAGIAATILCTLATGLFVLGMYILRPPAAPGPKDGTVVLQSLSTPLRDHTGAPVQLADYRGKGPVLLVFYRGHW